MPGTTISNFAIISKYEYDWLNRLKVFSKKFGSLDYKKLAQYDYDEMGRVKNKKLSPDYNGGAGIETFRYDYNIRGWLNGINKDYALGGISLNQWDHFFGMYMGYDNRDNKFTAARYDGNLTGTIWKTQGDNMPRRYDYQYDNAGRFTQALFLQKEKPTDAAWNNLKMDFSVTGIQYDENNNLLQMNQKGVLPGNNTPVLIDKLLYEYKQVGGASWSNQLRRVYDQTTDMSAANNGALGDFKDENYGINTDDYLYDGNGNLVRDNNKKIRAGAGNGVVYNFMDKPQKITIEGKSIIDFTYDAGGAKLAKKVTNTASGTWKTTWYMGDYIYEETGTSAIKLTIILHEEGRVRVVQPITNPRITQGGYFDLVNNSDLNKGVFDFFIKDNLENTRMIVTEETHTEFHNATMEDALAAYEERMFGQVDANGNPLPGSNELLLSRVNKSEAPLWNANTSLKISKLSLGGRKLGPNMALKVMAGDNITAKTDYYYTGSPDNPVSSTILNNVVSSLLNVLSNGAPTGGLHGSATSITTNITANPGDLGSFLNSQTNAASATPQAYMNILFFDENFNFVPYDPVTGLGSYAWRVGEAGDGKSIPLQISKAPKNGYAFIYLSNESQTNVFFDNFEVTHIRGAITEENAYYPYGLKIKGLSAKSFDKGDNKYGYQGSFSEEEEETGWDEFDLRMYDPQIGRWTGVDPYDEFASPYLGMGANPVNNVDPDGGSIGAGGWGAIFGAIGGFSSGFSIASNNGKSFGSSIAWGFAGAFVGAGFGYAIGESLNPSEGVGGCSNQSKSFFGNLLGFYKGMIPGNSNDPMWKWNTANDDGLFTANIWGDKSVSEIIKSVPSSLSSIADAISPGLTVKPTARTPTSIIQIPPSGQPIVNNTLCFTVNRISSPRKFRFDFTGNSPEGNSYQDAGITQEQINVITNFIASLRASMLPGDRIVSATLTHTMNYGGVLPQNNIPIVINTNSNNSVNVGGTRMQIGSGGE